MRTIHLHGALGEKYGTTIQLDVATAAEAVRALATNFPEIMKDFRENDWHVVRGKTIEGGLDLGEEDLIPLKLGRGDLHFVPVVAGSKREGAGLLKIILGVALVGLGFFMGFSTPIFGAASGGLLGGLTYGNLAMIGVALAAAGISQLLAPEEKDQTKQDSFLFNGPGNAYEQGSPVPLVYGEVITGSVMVSGGLDIEKIAVGS